MKKGRFTATVIAMLMLAQPVYAQDVTSTMISTEMQESSESVEETQEEQVENGTVIESEDESEFIASGGIIQYDVSQTSEKDSQPAVLTKTPKQDNNETTIVLAPNNQEKAGWQSEDGKSYYYDANGDKCVGEQNIGGKWYYFDKNGVMQTGMQSIPIKTGGMKTVYYGQDGAMLYGKQKIGEKYYYFHLRTGAMQHGEQRIDGKWCYCDEKTGELWIGLQTITMRNGQKKTVYYDTEGNMHYGEQHVDGKWYLFDGRTGAMQTGFQKLPNKIVYYGQDGAMCYGEQNIGGKWYYFHTITGAMQTGFKNIAVKGGGTKTVYYGTYGAMRYGEQNINGKGYYFHTITGAMQTGLIEIKDSVWGFYGADGKQIPMIDAKTAIDAAHEFLKETISDEDLEIIKGHYVQYLSAEPEMVDGHSNPQYYIYAIVTEDDADFDENTDEDDVIYGDVIRVDAVTKECVYDTDVSGID